jgi:hypothetical protein
MPRWVVSELVPHGSRWDYRAVRPALEGAIVRRLDGLSCSEVRQTSWDMQHVKAHQGRIGILREER